jgi:two-component system nitrogen regulation sensor histidine kinase NtrY
MMILKSKSLERYITRRLFLFGTAVFFLLYLLLELLALPLKSILLAMGGAAIIIITLTVSFYKKIVSSFDRALWHVEAIRQEDYNLTSKKMFEEGKVSDFHYELKKLSQSLSIRKSRYDQHAFLVYQLIDQLNTPVLVFNTKNKLTYANAAFSLFYSQPWQMYLHASPKLLGLVIRGGQWDFQEKFSSWKISQSRFIDNSEAHQLLIFINIESDLSESQLKAWQQIIRVIAHEINNSLTPVSSLAESLLERTNTERDRQALALISSRCHHLQDFIDRYSSLAKPLNFSFHQIAVAPMLERLKVIFPHLELNINVAIKWIWADQAFFEQVLINLIKNADEAEANLILISAYEINGKINIEIIDNGHGFSNLDNLFVPLFSTKQNGQGIGLSFCRNIIIKHKGSIEMRNNQAQGVTVTITLPIRPDLSSPS